MQAIVTSFRRSVDQGVTESLQKAGYEKVTATKLVTEFPGLDLIDLRDELTRAKHKVSGLTEKESAERVAEFGKGVAILYRKKRNKKPPKGSLVDDLVVGISLLTALTERLEREFRRSADIASSTFTGSGFYADAHLGSLIRLTSQLDVVSRSLHQLTELAHVFREKDIHRDIESLGARHDDELEPFVDNRRTTAFSHLWWQWCWGYGLPGRFIKGSEKDDDRFAPWRYMSWGPYFQRALYFYSAAEGKEADHIYTASDGKQRKTGHIYSAADGKQCKKGRAQKLFAASWEAIRERVELSLPENDDRRSLVTTKPSPRRRSTHPRTPEVELMLKNSDLLDRRAVKVWRCDSCQREVQPFDTSHNSMSKYDSYICPTWHNCGGILRPVFDDS